MKDKGRGIGGRVKKRRIKKLKEEKSVIWEGKVDWWKNRWSDKKGFK